MKQRFDPSIPNPRQAENELIERLEPETEREVDLAGAKVFLDRVLLNFLETHCGKQGRTRQTYPRALWFSWARTTLETCLGRSCDFGRKWKSTPAERP